jgi:hypothetical protein
LVRTAIGLHAFQRLHDEVLACAAARLSVH